MNRIFRLVRASMFVLLLAAVPAWAQVQARLDRNPIDLGESVVLTLDNLPDGATPDVSPLMGDFELLDQASSRSMQYANGQTTSRSVIRLTLAPKRAGSLAIPALQIGQQRSPAITLTVRPGAPVGSRDNNADIFLETTLDDSAPYVQQSVGVVLRLYYAVPLISGELDLDPPKDAMLQKIGDDIQGGREINGRRYNMVERRFLLVPERSGTLTVPGPRFRGRGAGGWFDDLMGGGRRELTARGPARTLQVRAQPANAPQPWLPLRDLRLRYLGAPTSARVGEAATLIVEGLAQGATQAQLPQIPTPAVSGAQVFPEPVQYDETFVDGTPQVKWTQRYAVVPDRPGDLVVRGLTMPWWDVAAGQPKIARLPDVRLAVAPGGANAGAPRATSSSAPVANGTALADAASASRWPRDPWVWLAVAFAALWLLTLMWALRRRAVAAVSPTPRMSVARAASRYSLADLKRCLDTGSLDEVADVLRELHAPPLRDLDAVIAQLDSPPQREALEALRRARWADGDAASARAALRSAFAKGPQWRRDAATGRDEGLPPLYPSA